MMKKPTKGIAVDGACAGNPGLAEFKIVDIRTNKVLVQRKIGIGTNNHAEFIALCEAVFLFPNENIYSDSSTAISWVYDKGSRSSMYHEELEFWDFRLNTLDELPNIIKWQTKLWGEIPADFGRK